ncbi:YueI family protein [Proteinivorax tanatarense]|uniref:YueI family protein n=1 Tax=Proteinivorax tanatarense TaxID=1260629 RepID=A0AAU7VLP0_9FIRM
MDQKEKIKRITSKDPLEQALLKGHGVNDIKADEKKIYLGQFRERVLIALTINQVHQPGTYPEVTDSIKHSRARKLILNRQVNLDRAADYINLARDKNLDFTTVSTKKNDTDIGLIVAADDAVEEEHIFVKDLSERFVEVGLDPKLINLIGEKICRSCYKDIEAKAPELLHLFKEVTFLDKITGVQKCC